MVLFFGRFLHSYALGRDGRELDGIGTDVRGIKLQAISTLAPSRKRGYCSMRERTVMRWKFSSDPFVVPGRISKVVRAKVVVDKTRETSGAYR